MTEGGRRSDIALLFAPSQTAASSCTLNVASMLTLRESDQIERWDITFVVHSSPCDANPARQLETDRDWLIRAENCICDCMMSMKTR
jgi:hypothetical protein